MRKNIKEKVKSIIEKIEGLSFEYNDWTRANITLDNKELPTCLYLLPVSGSLNMHNGIIRDKPDCLIAFIDKDELDFDGEQNDEIMERMKDFARRFIVEVNKSGLFKPVDGNFIYTSIWDKLDVNLTGIVLEIRLEELDGVCVR
jgi:hypothetical protein